MKRSVLTSAPLLILSALFTLALMFAFIELPPVVDSLMGKWLGFPGFDQGAGEMNAYKADLYIAARGLRVAGYLSLAAIVGLIVAGYLSKRTGWAIGGAALAFLPVFGGFAMSMFYLAGLGVFRSVLIPLTDLSPLSIELGDIIYVPYWIIIRAGMLFGYYAHDLSAWLFMGTGGAIFFLGVYEWASARFSRQGVAKGFIYRYSRHPQYLGWIIWSYGYFLYTLPLNNMKKSWGFDPSISWLLMTMIIIGVCMAEELKMKRLHGESYNGYRSTTPFLVPLPAFLRRMISYPSRLITGKSEPGSGADILKIVSIYTLLLMLLSIPVMKFTGYGNPFRAQGESSEVPGLDWIEKEIAAEGSTRRMSQLFDMVTFYGDEAEEMLTRVLYSGNEAALRYVPYSLSRIRSAGSVEALRGALGDTTLNIDFRLINALGEQAMPGNAEIIYNYWLEGGGRAVTPNVVTALGNVGYEPGWEIFEEQFAGGAAWHHRSGALNAMVNTNRDRALEYVYTALGDPDPGVKRQAVQYLLEWKLPESVPYLKKVSDDPDFETRFYARQAIKAILKQDNR